MLGDIVQSFCTGTAASLLVSSPAEWAIHRYLLHAPRTLRDSSEFIERASFGHNDCHHRAYDGPAHYYRDSTNEHEVIHFAKSDVGLIAGISTFTGFALNRGYALIAQKPDFTQNDGAFVAGFLAGSMMYYGTYELTHHHMHVIGKRRLAINRVLGDIIQGGVNNRDGNLRLSKPLLDDACNAIERHVDDNASSSHVSSLKMQPSITERLAYQLEVNRTRPETQRLKHPYIGVFPGDEQEVLRETAGKMLELERTYRSELEGSQKAKYLLSRRLQRTLRSSSLFHWIDNHHFFHHYRYGSNLNVVFRLMDILSGTNRNSSDSVLDDDTKVWLCPNSPDVIPFERPARRTSRLDESVVA